MESHCYGTNTPLLTSIPYSLTQMPTDGNNENHKKICSRIVNTGFRKRSASKTTPPSTSVCRVPRRTYKWGTGSKEESPILDTNLSTRKGRRKGQKVSRDVVGVLIAHRCNCSNEKIWIRNLRICELGRVSRETKRLCTGKQTKWNSSR